MSCVFFLRSTQTFVGPLLILNTFVEIMCCSSFHTSHAVMRTTCSSAHKSFLPFNRSVCLGVLWIRNMCGSDLKSVCAHVLRGALFVQLILLWSGSRSGTRGPTVVPASCSSLLPYALYSKPHQFPPHLPKYCSRSSEISLLLRLSSLGAGWSRRKR